MALGFLAATSALAGGWLPGVSKREKERTRPPLRIDYDRLNPDCRMDRRANHPQADLQLRLQVTNWGPVGLENVRLKLVNREPGGGHAHFLALMHDNQEPFARSNYGESCPVGFFGGLYFDFVGYLPRFDGALTFGYANAYLWQEQLTPRGTYRLTVEAEGRWEDSGVTAPKTYAVFEVSCPGVTDLDLRLIAEDERASEVSS